jgi:DNA polymerase elongation subunit (family B)
MTIEFQIYDFVEDHDIVEDDTEDDHKPLGDYIIHVFGRTEDGKSVYTKVTGFTPYFYISLPDSWEKLSKQEINKKLEIMEKWFKSKDNKKIWMKHKDTLLNIDLVKRKKAEGFTNGKEFNFARLVFNNSFGMKKFSYMLDNEIMIPGITSKPTKFKLYESNLLPMLRCFHIRKIRGCDWVTIENYKKVKSSNKISTCNLEFNVDWQNITPIKKDTIAPLIIASFDIECFSHDGDFPQAIREKDCIIQIGMTYTKLGESLPYRKWIGCLEETSNFDLETIVESFESEQELIDSWIKEINDNDCDIITGYNIFGFDEKYIFDRCNQVLNMKTEIGYISKLKNRDCEFKERKLESSALGENHLSFWDTPGRVHIDLMKDIQKTFNFTSYRLDAMLSHFVRGEVKSYKKINDDNHFEMICASVDDIQLNDYVHIEVIKGFVSDELGEKYMVISINREEKTLIVNGDSILDAELEISRHGCKIFWTQAKDDVGPKDIFRMQKQGPKERAVIAKYCVKDCTAVNLLMNKLQVVTKNIAMANVSSVPLSYLFSRGQGIKLFSLTLKQYREDGYIFPVLKAKKDKDGNTIKEDSYEGAIVINPVPQIDYEANSTKDYASLYPSSILQKNMSHESEIIDQTYDNLEGVTYYNASFKENDGKTKYCRFAKVNNQLSVIPKILDNLMKERKAIKKLMKNEKNPFKYMILDAQQLAVKVTANSLYGQLGASVSPIANRNIAACTTSTGREMLLFAKKYDEELLPWLINGLKHAYINDNEEQANKLLDYELKARDDTKLVEKIKRYCCESIKYYTLQPIIRYGDSVTSYTPIYIKVNNQVEILTIEQLGKKYGNNNWLSYIEEKEFCELVNIETWSDKGWTKLYRVIRHKLDPNKKILRISTNHGLVDVTDDHSLLLDLNGDFNDDLNSDFNDEFNRISTISPKNLTTNDYLFHNKFCEIANDNEFKNINNIYSIHVPTMLEASYYINYLNSINYFYYYIRCKNDNSVCVHIGLPLINNHRVNSITEIKYDGYVYDLTTENHHFAAGVGNMIVHNTDSVFCCFRFRTGCDELDYKHSLKIFKQVMQFSKELIIPLMVDDEAVVFIDTFDTYFSDVQIDCLTLPDKLIVPPIPNNYETVLPLNDRIKQFIKEFIFENYFSWLWTLQEVVNKNFSNIENKLFDWAEYLLEKSKLTFNNLKEKRINVVIPQLLNIIETNYYDKVHSKIIWSKPTSEFISMFAEKIKTIFVGEYEKPNVDLNKVNTDILRITKNFLENKLKEEWINAGDSHDSELTKIKKKLKRERNFNNKSLKELLIGFIETSLKLNFNKYKIEHENKIKNFINNVLKDNWLQPYWTIENDKRIYNMKIYNGGYPIIEKTTLDLSIEIGELSGELVKSRLPFPHDLEYEKTFWPFLILTKKRYVGNKYEFDPNKFKQDFMGIVLKRRDNAPIVKEICSGIINYLINKKDPFGAKEFAEQCLEDMFQGKYDIKYFLQSRNLKSKESYADWTKLPHVFLAEKIGQRDPGNKPQSGDRIEFAVTIPPNFDPKKKYLQGELVETPDFIKKNNIPINYMFYMENQIMNPSLQFLELVDSNAKELFSKMKEKYGIPKEIKEKKAKIIKTPKPKKVVEPIEIIQTDEEPVMFNKKKNTKKKENKKNSKKTIIEIDTTTINEELVIQVKKKKTKEIQINEEPIIEVNKESVIETTQVKKKKTKEIQIDTNTINKEPIIEVNKESVIKTTQVKKKKTKEIQIDTNTINKLNEELVIETIQFKKKKTNNELNETIQEKKKKTKEIQIIEEPINETIQEKKKKTKEIQI